jgi:hypothetical protein
MAAETTPGQAAVAVMAGVEAAETAERCGAGGIRPLVASVIS